jgi:hypothetical protein
MVDESFSMVTYKGSHGTTIKSAGKIQSEGFLLSGGRFVRGAYFWLECYNYSDLAVGWFKQRLAGGYYNDEDSPQCAVIFVQLCCNDDEIMDLEMPDFKDRLARLSDTMHTDQHNDREVKSMYAYAIKEMEKRGNLKFKLFLMKVDPPGEIYCPRYRSRILGPPITVVCVSNKNIEIKNILNG